MQFGCAKIVKNTIEYFSQKQVHNVNKVVLICATRVQLSTIPCSQKIIKHLSLSTTSGDNVPKNFKFESCERQTLEIKKKTVIQL